MKKKNRARDVEWNLGGACVEALRAVRVIDDRIESESKTEKA